MGESVNLRPMGCAAGRSSGPMPAPHAHNDVELNFLVRGSGCYEMSGQRIDVEAPAMLVMWSIFRHCLVEASGDHEQYWAHVPLGELLSWNLPRPFLQLLLRGRLVVEAPSEQPAADAERFDRWHRDFREMRPETREATHELFLLEAHARLRRLARKEAAVVEEYRPDVSERAIAIIGIIADESHDPAMSVNAIAERVGLHPKYAMRLFRRAFGMTIHEYLTLSRIRTAQQLLTTTDRKVIDVALASGFATPGRFYEQFHRLVGQTPSRYRREGERHARGVVPPRAAATEKSR